MLANCNPLWVPGRVYRINAGMVFVNCIGDVGKLLGNMLTAASLLATAVLAVGFDTLRPTRTYGRGSMTRADRQPPPLHNWSL